MEHKLKELGYLLNVEEEEHVGGLQRRQPWPTENFEASTVFADLVSAGISTVGSNISTITDEEQEPELKPEHEQAKQHEPDDGFQVNVERLVSNASPGDGRPVAAAGVGDGVVAEGNDGKGICDVWEEELHHSVSFKKEHGIESAHEHQEAEHVDVGFVASKTDLIYGKYDLIAEKPNGQEDLIKNFHEIRDHDVGISASWKVPVDGACDLTAEIHENREALRPLNDEHENLANVRLPFPRKSYQEETAITLIEEVEPEETEYDAERVLQKQNTHELFCPNCHSCITIKVILQRTRMGRGVIVTPPRNGPDVPFVAPTTDACHEVVKCLSCLTFFIPTGDCFKLKGREPRTVQGVPDAGAPKNSFLSLLWWRKKPAVRGDGGEPLARNDHNLVDGDNPPQVDTQPPLNETRTAGVPEARDFDILKSIVYGGLLESIASLGVVSSAAGGGAATLSTLALALANLITGLFVLVHNLRELRSKHSSEAETQSDMEEDRYYQQQLGRGGKFSLHATVAVVSYLVFGLVAPITYGFSFRKSDNRDYKLAAAAAASLLCILLLALGKAHVRSKSYIKTVLYYLTTGFAASGISFLVGELVDKLLERLGLFESGSSSTLVSGVLGGMSMSGLGWASH